MENNMQQFIDEIMKQSGLKDMPKDFIDEYKEKMTQEAQKRLGLISMKELSAEEIEELNKIIEESSNDPEKITDYLTGHIENYQEKMTEALKEFGHEVIASAKKINS